MMVHIRPVGEEPRERGREREVEGEGGKEMKRMSFWLGASFFFFRSPFFLLSLSLSLSR